MATTTNIEDEVIYNKSIELGVNSSRGSESDVLDRFYKSVEYKNPDWIVRVTSDCPLIDPKLVDDVIAFTIKNNKDYVTNTLMRIFLMVKILKFLNLRHCKKLGVTQF